MKITDHNALKEYLIICFTKQTDVGYTERHHILPKSIFPEYKDFKTNNWNCSRLSYIDHCRAHYWIWKATNDYKMWNAVNAMCNTTGGDGRSLTEEDVIISASIWQEAKENAPPMSEEHRRNIGNAGKGRKLSDEHVAAIVRYNTGKVPSTETRRKIATALTGIPLSEYHKDRIGDALRDKPKPTDFGSKISDSWKNEDIRRIRSDGIKRTKRRGWVWEPDNYFMLYDMWVESGKLKSGKFVAFCKSKGINVTRNEIRIMADDLFIGIIEGTQEHYHQRAH